MSLTEQIAQAEAVASTWQKVDPAFNWSDVQFLCYWIDLCVSGQKPYHGMSTHQVVMTATLKRALNMTRAQCKLHHSPKRDITPTFRSILVELTEYETPINVGESRAYPIPDIFKVAWLDVKAAIHQYVNAKAEMMQVPA